MIPRRTAAIQEHHAEQKAIEAYCTVALHHQRHAPSAVDRSGPDSIKIRRGEVTQEFQQLVVAGLEILLS